jgi:CubicO group peptidase (beta-lactamase class C family)
MRKLIFGLLFLFVTNLIAKAQLPDSTVHKVQSYLKTQQQRIGFNGVLLIAKGKKILFSQAIGEASFELDAPLNTAAVFKVASVSKSFTAMLVMIATEEHRISLNDSLI